MPPSRSSSATRSIRRSTPASGASSGSWRTTLPRAFVKRLRPTARFSSSTIRRSPISDPCEGSPRTPACPPRAVGAGADTGRAGRLRRIRRPGSRGGRADGRAHRGRGGEPPCRTRVHGVHAGLLSGLRLPRRRGPSPRGASEGDAAAPRAEGLGGDRRPADRHLSGGLRRGLEPDRADERPALRCRPGFGGAHPSRRPRALRARPRAARSLPAARLGGDLATSDPRSRSSRGAC